MNLHQLISPIIGAVNPNQMVAIRVSIGDTEAPDGSQSPAYATPGAITASVGGTFTASASGTILIVSGVSTGSLQATDDVSGTDGTNTLPEGTFVVEQLTGAAGGIGTYELNQAATLNSCTVTSESTVLNVSAISGGALLPGQTLADTGAVLLPGTIITGQLPGTPTGGPGLYTISEQQTVASEAMTTSLSILAQIQAMTGGQLRHMDMLNIQGSHKAIYITGKLSGAVRVALKGGDQVILPNGSVWLVTQSLEPFADTAGWTKACITLQDGS